MIEKVRLGHIRSWSRVLGGGVSLLAVALVVIGLSFRSPDQKPVQSPPPPTPPLKIVSTKSLPPLVGIEKRPTPSTPPSVVSEPKESRDALGRRILNDRRVVSEAVVRFMRNQSRLAKVRPEFFRVFGAGLLRDHNFASSRPDAGLTVFGGSDSGAEFGMADVLKVYGKPDRTESDSFFEPIRVDVTSLQSGGRFVQEQGEISRGFEVAWYGPVGIGHETLSIHAKGVSFEFRAQVESEYLKKRSRKVNVIALREGAYSLVDWLTLPAK